MNDELTIFINKFLALKGELNELFEDRGQLLAALSALEGQESIQRAIGFNLKDLERNIDNAEDQFRDLVTSTGKKIGLSPSLTGAKYYPTRDYGLFSIPITRPIHEPRLEDLINSIKTNNQLHENPITVNKRMEVLDGGYRLEAAKRLRINIFYTYSQE